MEKALEQMNVKLTEVVSDITGVTGMGIVRAIVRGERDPKALATAPRPPLQGECGDHRAGAAGDVAARAPVCLAAVPGVVRLLPRADPGL